MIAQNTTQQVQTLKNRLREIKVNQLITTRSKKKLQLHHLQQNIQQILFQIDHPDHDQPVIFQNPINLELKELHLIQNQKYNQIQQLNEKIFSKMLQKYEHLEKQKDSAQQEQVYKRANDIKQQNEQLGILISKEHLDSYYLEGKQYKQVGEGLKEQISQVIKDCQNLTNEIKVENDSLSQLRQKLTLQKTKNNQLKIELKSHRK